MHWYWWAWFAIVFFLVLLPLFWGWAYRGWGPPYPRYYVRRRRTRVPPAPRGGTSEGEATRTEVMTVVEEPPVPPPSGWGVAADLFWLAVLGAGIWFIVAWAY